MRILSLFGLPTLVAALSVVAMLLASDALAQAAPVDTATVQAAASLIPGVPPGLADTATRFGVGLVLLVLGVEVVRRLVPGWEHAKGVKLTPLAKRILLGLVLFGGQLLALVGGDAALVRLPWPGTHIAVIAGALLSFTAVAFNELLWKRLSAVVTEKLGKRTKKAGGAS